MTINIEKWVFLMLLSVCTADHVTAQMGIGIAAPKARLHVHDGSVLAITPLLPPEISPMYDPANGDTDPVFNAFKWIKEKNAFRALGTGATGLWSDPLKVGRYSFNSGFDSFSEGIGASAMGIRVYSNGMGSFAVGQHMIAGFNFSFAQGFMSQADAASSLVMGTNLSNNYQEGSFILGHDVSSGSNALRNEIRMLFDGGYRFFTNANLTTEVLLAPGDNAWSIISDVNKKENIAPVDGSDVLRKISRISLTSWNYKGQSPATTRHYGPMAQDFFAAFGRDTFGVIGTDTTINQADLDGITLIAIKSLVQDVDELEKLNDCLEIEILNLEARLSKVHDSRYRSKRVSRAGNQNVMTHLSIH